MAETGEKTIITESLTKIYQGRQIALNCVNLTVERGTCLGVLGQNGAGKTTLVRLLMGLHVPTSGRVYILGKRMTPNAGKLRRRIGFLPAEPKFPEGMTSIDYLDFVGQLAGLTKRSRRPRLAMLMRAVDLLNASGEKIRFLSTGMRTRLAIAASLINDPEVLIWDEPAHALDPGTRRTMIELMRSLSDNKTLLLCTHNLLDVQEVCDRSIVLHEGQLIFDGAVTELAGSLKPSSIEITLKGEKKHLQESYKTMQAMDELESCTLQKNVLRLKIRADVSHAAALATALQVVADHKVEVVDLKPAGQQADQALANLVLKETGRGLTRAYQTVNI